MILLNVPYSEKDEAKILGAKWNSNLKKWSANVRDDYRKFSKWIDGDIIIKEKILIVEGKQSCWKCHKKTKVYAVGALSEDIIDFDKDTEVQGSSIQEKTGFDIQIWPVESDVPIQLRSHLADKFGCKVKYSYTEKRSYFANVCSNCDSLQGNFYLYMEPESPFGYMNESELILYQYPLKYDLISRLSLDSCISPSYEYLKRSVIKKVDLEIN